MPTDRRGRPISPETIAMGTSHGENDKEKEFRKAVKLRPLDRHYGQRYPQYERQAQNPCDVCGDQAVVKINGELFCETHFQLTNA